MDDLEIAMPPKQALNPIVRSDKLFADFCAAERKISTFSAFLSPRLNFQFTKNTYNCLHWVIQSDDV